MSCVYMPDFISKLPEKVGDIETKDFIRLVRWVVNTELLKARPSLSVQDIDRIPIPTSAPTGEQTSLLSTEEDGA